MNRSTDPGDRRSLRLTFCVLALAAASPAQTQADKAMSVWMKMGFGPTPAQLAAGSASPAALLQQVNQQLNTSFPLVLNADTAAALAAFNDPQLPAFVLPATQGAPGNQVSLLYYELARALYTDHQLVENMTQFWDAHFNTYFFKVRTYFTAQGFGVGPAEDYATWFEKLDNDYYRDHSLGTFRDLLTHTAESVAMLINLDNYASTATQLNENWGRELLELYTQGKVWEGAPPTAVATNYTQDDVIGVAKCFTGWTIVENAGVYGFATDDANHDTTAKNLFSVTGRTLKIPAGGTASFDGNAVLDYLVKSPRTKDNIVRKLMSYLFGDTAAEDNPSLLAQAIAAWGNDGDIKAVLTVLLTSPQFVDAQYRWAQASDPLHFTVSMQRRAGALLGVTGSPPVANLNRLFGTAFGMATMGQTLHSYPAPNGYPIASDQQVGSSIYLEHVLFAGEFTKNGTLSLVLVPHQQVLAGLSGSQQTDPVAVAAFLFKLFFADKPPGPLDLGLIEQTLQNLPDPSVPANLVPYAQQIQAACERIFLMTHGAVK